MKRKAHYHAETKELPNGRFAVLRQWVDGGSISCDDNNGDGFELEEATALVAQHNSLNKTKPL